MSPTPGIQTDAQLYMAQLYMAQLCFGVIQPVLFARWPHPGRLGLRADLRLTAVFARGDSKLAPAVWQCNLFSSPMSGRICSWEASQPPGRDATLRSCRIRGGTSKVARAAISAALYSRFLCVGRLCPD
jgi:hypothetical protein